MDTPERIDIVLVGDVVDEGSSRPTVFDWDNPTWPEVEQLVAWFAESGRRAEIVASVPEFVSKAAAYADRIVFPLWRGGSSRNRTAIVPAVCEAYGLSYVGADAYTQAVCQDKSLSKVMLAAVGLVSPQDVVVQDASPGPQSLRAIERLRFPVVVKPLTSACSIGVGIDSLCSDLAAVVERVRDLTEKGLGPAICEEFVAGDEVSLCLVEIAGEIDLHCTAAHRTTAGTCPFHDRLFTHEEKIARERDWEIGLYPGEVTIDIWRKVEALLPRIGPFDLLRVDGRINEGHFTVIELTPDIHLGIDSAFLGGFNADGVPPSAVLDRIVKAASVKNWSSGRIDYGVRGKMMRSGVHPPAAA